MSKVQDILESLNIKPIDELRQLLFCTISVEDLEEFKGSKILLTLIGIFIFMLKNFFKNINFTDDLQLYYYFCVW